MYRLYLVNHYYFSGTEYATLEEAKAAVMRSTFETTIYQGDKMVAHYGIFSGWNFYDRETIL